MRNGAHHLAEKQRTSLVHMRAPLHGRPPSNGVTLPARGKLQRQEVASDGSGYFRFSSPGRCCRLTFLGTTRALQGRSFPSSSPHGPTRGPPPPHAHRQRQTRPAQSPSRGTLLQSPGCTITQQKSLVAYLATVPSQMPHIPFMPGTAPIPVNEPLMLMPSTSTIPGTSVSPA